MFENTISLGHAFYLYASMEKVGRTVATAEIWFISQLVRVTFPYLMTVAHFINLGQSNPLLSQFFQNNENTLYFVKL